MDRSDLVVGPHDGDENRVRTERFLQLVQIDPPAAINLKPSDLIPLAALELLARVEHGFVLGRLRDDVPAAIAIAAGHALDGEGVWFGGAGWSDGADRFG